MNDFDFILAPGQSPDHSIIRSCCGRERDHLIIRIGIQVQPITRTCRNYTRAGLDSLQMGQPAGREVDARSPLHDHPPQSQDG